MENRNNDLPDISGVFQIDESKIPTRVIEKPAAPRPAAAQGDAPSILLQKQSPKEERKSYEKMSPEAARRTKKRQKDQRQKLFRQRLILAGIALVLLLVAVLGIRALILKNRRPTVETVPVVTGALSSHYDTDAVILSEESADGERRIYAVFVDNDSDLHGISAAQDVKVRMEGDLTATGVISEIRKEESGSELVARLLTLTPDASFSTATNYVVMVWIKDSDSAIENSQVKLEITTNKAEDAKLVPLSAVRYDDSGSAYLWAYKSFGKKLVKVPVSLGLTSDGMAVVSNVATGTQVVYAASVDVSVLGEGMKVRANVHETQEDALKALPEATSAAPAADENAVG